jgi:anhydro-N-acetylmuramic acid kinase
MPQPVPVKAIGVISGTSMDGIDVSMVETDGDRSSGRGRGGPTPTRRPSRASSSASSPSRRARSRSRWRPRPGGDGGPYRRHPALHGGDRRRRPERGLIGFHGQTVYHRPEARFTRQLGRAPRVAEALGIDTVDRFRHADVASGGEGAPFAPLYHRALASRPPSP